MCHHLQSLLRLTTMTCLKNSIYLDVNVGTKSGKITITNEEDRPALTITNSQVIEGNYGVLTLGVTKGKCYGYGC